MTRLFCILLTLLFSLSGPAMGEYSDFCQSSNAPGRAPQAIGFTRGTAGTAFDGMRGGGGHAMRKLISEGVIPNSGSLSSRVQTMKNLLVPVLESPARSFTWRVGATQAKGFIGNVGGRNVFVFVATEGPYQGKVISSGVVSASDWALWGLVP